MFYAKRVTELKPGVNIFGYFFAEHGIGEEARMLVQIVQHAGLDFAVIPYTETFSRQAARCDERVSGEAVYDINLICVNADAIPHFVRHFGSAILAGRYNIGMWAWEVAEFPDWMARSAQFLDEIWGCSSFTAEAIGRCVPLPVFPLLPPISIADLPPVRRQDLGLSEQKFIFLFCFDFNSIFERKNVLATVAAFKLAFPPGHGAELWIKTINGNDFPSQLERLSAATIDHPDIRVVDGYLSSAEQRRLMSACDAYISLHRSEGFGFTLAEAMALGKPVIATGYSGNLDFMQDENSYLVPYQLVGIPAGCDPYPQTSFWAEPDIGAAAGLMRRVFDRRDEARTKAAQAQRDMARWHTPQARAKFVGYRLATIRQGSRLSKESTVSKDRSPCYTVIGYDPRAAERGLSIRDDLTSSRERHTRSHREFESLKHLLATHFYSARLGQGRR